LLLGHLEGEDTDGLARLARGLLRDVEAERGLAHGRACRDDDQIALLQAAGLRVEVHEAGGQAGHELLRLRELVDGAEALLDDLAYADEAQANASLRDVEDRLLGPVQDDSGLVL